MQSESGDLLSCSERESHTSSRMCERCVSMWRRGARWLLAVGHAVLWLAGVQAALGYPTQCPQSPANIQV